MENNIAGSPNYCMGVPAQSGTTKNRLAVVELLIVDPSRARAAKAWYDWSACGDEGSRRGDLSRHHRRQVDPPLSGSAVQQNSVVGIVGRQPSLQKSLPCLSRSSDRAGGNDSTSVSAWTADARRHRFFLTNLQACSRSVGVRETGWQNRLDNSAASARRRRQAR